MKSSSIKIKDLLNLEESTPVERMNITIAGLTYDVKAIEWRLPDGRLHRQYGPAVESEVYCAWLFQNQFHREDGPAVIYPDGRVEYWLNGVLHRVGYPAIITFTGEEQWYLNGIRHREDGPEFYSPESGKKKHFINGVSYSEEDFIKKR